MTKGFFQHRVTRNASALLILQLVNYVAPFVVLIYLTRVLGITTYGVVAFSVSITQLAFVVLDFGFCLSATQKISVWREKKKYVARLVGAIFVVKIVAFMVVSVFLVTYALMTEKYSGYSLLFLFSLLPIFAQCFQPEWFFSGIERMRFITIFMVVAKSLFVLLVVLLVATENDYLWVPIASGIAQLTASVLAIFLMYKIGYTIGRPNLRYIKYAVHMTSGFFVSRLSVTAYLNTGVILLGFSSTPATVAVYSLAEQLYRAMQSVFAPIAQALYPYMAKEKNLSLLRKIAMASVGIAAFGALCGFFLAPYVFSLLFGSGWDGAVRVFNVFLLAITVHVMTVMSGYPLAAAVGCLPAANRSVVAGSAVYIAGACALLLAGSATPVLLAWLMIVAESYVLIHRMVVLWPMARQIQMSKSY